MNRGERALAVLIGALLLGGTALAVIRATETDKEPLVLPPISPAPVTGTVPVSPVETFPSPPETTFPTVTPTAEPTSTVQQTESPEPTETAEPTESPEPSPTTSPAATPSPRPGAMTRPETPDTGIGSSPALGAMLLGGAGVAALAARRRRR